MNNYNIDEILKSDQIVIFGCGNIGCSLYSVLEKKHGNICAVTDNNKAKWGDFLKTTRIISPAEAVAQYQNALFCVANASHCDEIAIQLQNLGIVKEKIIKIDHDTIIKKTLIKSGMYSDENGSFIYNLPYSLNMKRVFCGIRYKVLDIFNGLKLIFRTVQGTNKKYKVSICAIFKDEANYLKEWIEFHRLVGIEHFYLYNNFSSDNYLDILSPYIENGLVTLTEWPVPQGQMKAYKDCLEKYRTESLWIGMIDLDEFVVPISCESVYSFLQQYDHKYGSILIYWKNFGTGGKIFRDVKHGLVTEDFTVCWRKHTDVGKCFVNTNFIILLDESNCIHHEAWTEFDGNKYPPINCYNHISLFQKFNIADRKPMPIQINHYLVKSYDEMKQKLEKGDVFYKENTYKQNYLMEYEGNNTSIDFSAYRYLLKLKIQMGMVKNQ